MIGAKDVGHARQSEVSPGSLLHTVQRLTEENLEERRDEVEIQLASLRRDAFAELEGCVAKTPWPSSFPDPFPRETGLAEVDASDLDVEVLGGALEHHGCLLVRRLFDEEVCTEVCTIMDRAFSAAEAAYEGAPVEQTAPWYVPLPPHPKYPARYRQMRSTATPGRVILADCPRGLFEITRAFKQSRFPAVAQDYLGGPLVMTENKWGLFKVPPRKQLNPMWHQEVSVFPKKPIRALNCWTAFKPCGRDAPGLRVVPRPIREVFPPKRGYVLDQALMKEVIEDKGEAQPEFGSGDALVFDKMTLHSPYYAPAMTMTRYSMEAWFFVPGWHPTELGGLAF